MSDTEPTRRSFIFGVSAIIAASATGGALLAKAHKKVVSTASQVAQKLPSVFKSAAPLPADPATNITGLSPLVTPIEDFFRIDTAVEIPQIDASTWSMSIEGMVDSPTTLNYEQIMAMPMIEVDCTIGCVSNSVGGSLVGNARWLGVKLSDVLDMAKPKSGADQILSWSTDGFSAGFPVAAGFDRDAILAVGMNGEILNAKHGFPVRLVVPGLYGYVSATKWLQKLELCRFDQKQGFWISRGWSQLGPVKTESRIDVPKQGQSMTTEPTHIAGVAWAPTKGIRKVEVQIDNGAWQSAHLGPEISNSSWRQWWIEWTPTSGKNRISVRATDGAGYTQTEKLTAIDPDGATGWHTIVVNVA